MRALPLVPVRLPCPSLSCAQLLPLSLSDKSLSFSRSVIVHHRYLWNFRWLDREFNKSFLFPTNCPRPDSNVGEIYYVG
jgi:hypothetical protein